MGRGEMGAYTAALYPKQRQFIESEAKLVAFVGGVGSGKTQAGAVKSLLLALRHPGIVLFVIAPIYRTLWQATMEKVWQTMPKGIREGGVFNKTDLTFKLENGSQYWFRSAEDPESLRGPTVGGVWLDEAGQMEERVFQNSIARLRQQGMPNQLYITTTPKGMNWVYRVFVVEKGGVGRELVQASCEDNIFLPSEYIELLRKQYPGDYGLQEIEGQFVVLGGRGIFPIEEIKRMMRVVREPIEERVGGMVKIWGKVEEGHSYIMGIDGSDGIGKDASCAQVVDLTSGELVCQVWGRESKPAQFAAVVAQHTYSYRPYTAVELAGSGAIIIDRLRDAGFRLHAYQMEKIGWRTDTRTKPLMVLDLEEAIRERALNIPDIKTLEEMLTYVLEETGEGEYKPGSYGASAGSLDDRVAALEIAWQMRWRGRNDLNLRPRRLTMQMECSGRELVGQGAGNARSRPDFKI